MSNDAQWYIERKEDDYYEIFFEMCRKFGISWARATEKEKMFIEEVTRVTYEHRQAEVNGTSTKHIQPIFSDQSIISGPDGIPVYLEIDHELYEQVSNLIAPMNITHEELIQVFLRWCTNPDTQMDAIIWLQAAMKNERAT